MHELIIRVNKCWRKRTGMGGDLQDGGGVRNGDHLPPHKLLQMNWLQRWVQAAAIYSDPRNRHEMLRLLLQPPRSLCASTGHYPHTCPRKLCSPSLPGSCGPQTTSPGEHTACNVTPASAATDSPHIPIITTIPLLPPAWVSQSPLISHCFNPVLSGQEEKPEGNLHTEVGPKPKLNPRGCANKEEKGTFLHAASGAAD